MELKTLFCKVKSKLLTGAHRVRRQFFGLRADALVQHGRSCMSMDTRYVWGGLGALITPELIEEKKAMYPDHFGEDRCRQLYAVCGKNVYGFDCSGLIKNFLMGGMKHFRYDPALDMNAKKMLDTAAEKGPVETLPEVPGLCLYMEGHVGIYAGSGTVIEATANAAFGDGVVETRLEDRQWLMWFRCPGIRYGK